MIKAVFMDFDGTVAESRKIHEQAILETLDKYGIDYDKKKLLSMLGVRLNIIFKQLNIRVKKFDRFRNEFYDSLTKKTTQTSVKKAVNLTPLKDIKVPIIIISNSKTKYLEKAIAVLKISKLFARVYGEEKFNSKEAMIKRLMKRYNITPQESLYLGDSRVDIDVARNCGCVSVVIANKNSWSSKKELASGKPDYMIENFSSLKELIAKN